MYKLKIDEIKKAFIIIFEGNFGAGDFNNFITEYNKCVCEINPGEYNLIIVGDYLLALRQEMLLKLQSMINMYKLTGFKNYFGTFPVNEAAKAQFQNIINKCNFRILIEPSFKDIYENLDVYNIL